MRLGTLDGLIVLGYLVTVALIGFLVGRRQTGTESYFLGSRRIAWWLAGLSIIATETSAITFIGAPIQSLRGDWRYLQLALGAVLGRIVVAKLLIPAYYRGRVYTVYGYLDDRFGPRSKNSAALLFFVGRCLGSGVRLYAAAIALHVVVAVSFPTAILLVALVAVAYTVMGGIRSVIYTDALQGMLLLGGGLAALVCLLAEIDLDLGTLIDRLGAATTASGTAKLRVFDFGFDLGNGMSFVTGAIGSAFLTMAMMGTDQDMMQRALTCKDERSGARSMLFSAFLVLPIVALFLAVGSLLWLALGGDAGAAELAATIAGQAGETDPAKGFDYLFPWYVVQAMPVGIKGLVVAGICAAAMSSLDSAISALSSTAVTTLWQPYVQPGRDEGHYLRVSRWLSLFFALILAAIAFLVWGSRSVGSAKEGFGVLVLGLKVLTWIFPPLLGIFLVGVMTRRGSDRGNLLALLVAIAVVMVLEFWTRIFGSQEAPMAWTLNSVVGTVVAATVAAVFAGPQPEGEGH